MDLFMQHHSNTSRPNLNQLQESDGQTVGVTSKLSLVVKIFRESIQLLQVQRSLPISLNPQHTLDVVCATILRLLHVSLAAQWLPN